MDLCPLKSVIYQTTKTNSYKPKPKPIPTNQNMALQGSNTLEQFKSFFTKYNIPEDNQADAAEDLQKLFGNVLSLLIVENFEKDFQSNVKPNIKYNNDVKEGGCCVLTNKGHPCTHKGVKIVEDESDDNNGKTFCMRHYNKMYKKDNVNSDVGDHVCEGIIKKTKKECKSKGKFEYNGSYYCKRHYNVAKKEDEEIGSVDSEDSDHEILNNNSYSSNNESSPSDGKSPSPIVNDDKSPSPLDGKSPSPSPSPIVNDDESPIVDLSSILSPDDKPQSPSPTLKVSKNKKKTTRKKKNTPKKSNTNSKAHEFFTETEDEEY